MTEGNKPFIEHLQHLPDRIKAIYFNVKLFRKCAADDKKDAQLWASRSEGDEGKEFERSLTSRKKDWRSIGSTWRPGEVEMRFSLHDLLANKKNGDSIIHESQ